MSKRFTGPMKPWPALDQYGRTLTLPESGLDLFFFDSGPAEGATILLVHGLGDEADTWRYLLPELAVGNRVLAVDLPGFGRSTSPGRSLPAPYLTSVLLELLDRLGVAQAVLVGSSLGGLLCQQIALSEPDRAAGLVLLDGTLLATGQALNLNLLLFMVPGLGELLYTRLRRDPAAAYETLQPYYADLEAMPAADRDFLYQRVNERVWSDSQRRAYFSVLRNLALWSPRQQKGLPGRLAGCQTPTLVLWGEQDRIIAMDAAQTLVRLQPTARLVTVPGAGHLPHQERPQAVLDAIRENGRLAVAAPGSRSTWARNERQEKR
jgi:pimeloyl-ACP methyl ester carboxylesterase